MKKADKAAKHLANELEFVTDGDVLVCRIDANSYKFMDRDGMVPDLIVSGTNQHEVCASMKAIEDALTFYLGMVAKED